MAANAPKTKVAKPAQSAETLIELCGLSVNFGRQAVLRDLSLAIPRRQTIGNHWRERLR